MQTRPTFDQPNLTRTKYGSVMGQVFLTCQKNGSGYGWPSYLHGPYTLYDVVQYILFRSVLSCHLNTYVNTRVKRATLHRAASLSFWVHFHLGFYLGNRELKTVEIYNESFRLKSKPLYPQVLLQAELFSPLDWSLDKEIDKHILRWKFLHIFQDFIKSWKFFLSTVLSPGKEEGCVT